MIERHRPTVLINVPTMVQQMVAHPLAARAGSASLRLSTSAGEALPPELYARWKQTFGVELLDGLGTAEMWHIFLSNRPGAVVPGTLGQRRRRLRGASCATKRAARCPTAKSAGSG